MIGRNARFRKCIDLVRECKVFVKNKAKVASRVGCIERGVVCFRKLLFKSNKKFSFRRVVSETIDWQTYRKRSVVERFVGDKFDRRREKIIVAFDTKQRDDRYDLN